MLEVLEKSTSVPTFQSGTKLWGCKQTSIGCQPVVRDTPPPHAHIYMIDFLTVICLPNKFRKHWLIEGCSRK